jgi:hypothetical protein
MARYSEDSWGTITNHIYAKGVITALNVADDTADVTVEGYANGVAIPLFYHCSDDAEERDNGALEGAAAAFSVDDEVIVMCEADTGDPIRIIGFVEGIKACILALVVRMSGKVVVWDMRKNEPMGGIIGLDGNEITDWPTSYYDLIQTQWMRSRTTLTGETLWECTQYGYDFELVTSESDDGEICEVGAETCTGFWCGYTRGFSCTDQGCVPDIRKNPWFECDYTYTEHNVGVYTSELGVGSSTWDHYSTRSRGSGSEWGLSCCGGGRGNFYYDCWYDGHNETRYTKYYGAICEAQNCVDVRRFTMTDSYSADWEGGLNDPCDTDSGTWEIETETRTKMLSSFLGDSICTSTWEYPTPSPTMPFWNEWENAVVKAYGQYSEERGEWVYSLFFVEDTSTRCVGEGEFWGCTVSAALKTGEGASISTGEVSATLADMLQGMIDALIVEEQIDWAWQNIAHWVVY